jgi:hypothetical protein
MTDDERVEPSEDIVVDEDMDEQLEDMSLEGRKAALTKARWNVFMYLGIAAILFGFALFPMPFGADYDNFTNSAEKDIGYIWGLPVPGDDITDVPVTISVDVINPPAQAGVLLGAYLIQTDDCQSNLGEFTPIARNGSGHNHHYMVTKTTPSAGVTYDFEFDVDPANYCMIVQYVNTNGDNVGDINSDMKVDGKMWPNQVFAGVLGLCSLILSAFAFIGAQKYGATVRTLLEGGNETTESKVLAELSKDKIAAGPAGAPPIEPTGGPTSGPTGGPTGGPTSGPTSAPTSGPPIAPPEEVVESEPVVEEVTEAATPVDVRYEETDNGYYFKILADGSYDQSVYVKAEDGSYSAYEE